MGRWERGIQVECKVEIFAVCITMFPQHMMSCYECLSFIVSGGKLNLPQLHYPHQQQSMRAQASSRLFHGWMERFYCHQAQALSWRVDCDSCAKSDRGFPSKRVSRKYIWVLKVCGMSLSNLIQIHFVMLEYISPKTALFVPYFGNPGNARCWQHYLWQNVLAWIYDAEWRVFSGGEGKCFPL